jgi:hypothetical protein
VSQTTAAAAAGAGMNNEWTKTVAGYALYLAILAFILAALVGVMLSNRLDKLESAAQTQPQDQP